VGSWVGPAATLLGVGWYFATCVILGVLLGRWADSQTGFEPAFTLTGILLGLAVAMVGGYRLLRPFIEKLGADSSGKG
jgi:hypothetical protein